MAPSLVAFSPDVRTTTVELASPNFFFAVSDIRAIELVPSLRWFLIVTVLTQVAAYHVRRSSERTKLRVHRSVVLALAVLHFTLVSSVMTYFYAVNYRLWTLWPTNPWFKTLILLLVALRSFAIQMFAFRRQSRCSLVNTLLLVPTIGIWLASVCGSLGILVIASASRAMEPSPVMQYVSRFSLTLGLACDMLIALTLYARPEGDILSHAFSSLTLPTSSKPSLFLDDYSLKARRRSSVGSPTTPLRQYDAEMSELGHRRHSTAIF